MVTVKQEGEIGRRAEKCVDVVARGVPHVIVSPPFKSNGK